MERIPPTLGITLRFTTDMKCLPFAICVIFLSNAANAAAPFGTVVAWGDNDAGQTAVPIGLTQVVAVSGGDYHTVALKSDGTVAAWGTTAAGFPNYGQAIVPEGLVGVTAIAAGGQHTIALKNDGMVVGWGRNDDGQWTIPPGLNGVAAIAAGSYHSVALRTDGTVIGWGYNGEGQTTVPAGLSGVTAIAAGARHTVALKDDGTVVAWGQNNFGQATVPAGLSGVTAIAAGNRHTIALKGDGTVVAWGDNFNGTSTPPPGLSGVTAIEAGEDHSVALKSNGAMVAWGGYNPAGEATVPMGLGGVIAIAAGARHSLAVRLPPAGIAVAWGYNGSGQTTVPPAAESDVIAVAARNDQTVALKSDGTVVAWGYNASGQTTVPVGLSGVMAIAAGNAHTLALTNAGTVLAWGSNGLGESNVPVAAQSGITTIAAGSGHSVALKADGGVIAWGYNNSGQTTVPVAAQSGVVAIAAGNYHTVALKSDGSVIAWGLNVSGQTTVPVAAQSGVMAIAAGDRHTVALKTNGTVVAWGSGGFSQTSVPAGLSGVTAIAAGGEHTVVSKSNGTVVAWGYNGDGQTTTPAGLSGVVAVAAGRYHTVALSVAAPPAPEIAVEQPAGTGLTNSVSVNFGKAGLEGAARSFTIRNTGTASLDGVAVNSAGGPNPGEFVIDPAPATTVAVGGSTTFTATFTPGASGTRSAKVAITSNDLDENPFELWFLGESVSSGPPIFISQPTSQLVRTGQSVSFSASVASALAVTRTWKRGSTSIANSNVLSYVIAGAKTTDAGLYRVEAKNTLGTLGSTVAFLGVITPGPAVVNVDLKTASVLNLACSAVAPAGVLLTYAWSRAGVALTNGGRTTGANTKALKINGMKVTDAGIYTCAVTMPTLTGNVQLSNGDTNVTVTPKPMHLAGSAATISNPAGTETITGAYTYTGYVGDIIDYTLSYANNTDADAIAVHVDCAMPANGSLMTDTTDAGWFFITIGGVKYIRWTLDMPAKTAGVKQFHVRIVSGKVGSLVALNASLKQGTKTLVTAAMPKVTLVEPMEFTLVSVHSDSAANGLTVHTEEWITYKMKLRNRSTAEVNNAKVGMAMPAGTLFSGPVGTIPDTTHVLNPAKTRIDFTMPSLLPGQSREVFVNVEARAADFALIKNSTMTASRPGGAVQTLAVFTTQVLPSLEVVLSADKFIARPGEIIRYTLVATNWAISAITDAKVVNWLPIGTALFKVATSNGADEPTGRGHFNQWPGLPAASLTPTSNPSLDAQAILTWELGTVPARVTRTIEFEVQVKHDIPTFAFITGVNTTLVINNFSYNFVGTPPSGTRRFAAKPWLGTSLASPTAAASVYLLSSVMPPRRSLLSDPPMTPPNLTLTKSAFADGVQPIAGEQVFTLINDEANGSDGRMIYFLAFSNAVGAGGGRNVVIRDYIPTGMWFAGFLTRNGTPVPSYLGFHFYDAAGKEIPGGGELFTDTNDNGIWNAGETFTDANGNKKYDSIFAIRSLDLPAGDLAGGAWGYFGYTVQTTSKPGTTIVSSAGGLTGVKDGLNYTAVPGYHLRADNLHFPVNGGPKQVKVMVTAPASFAFPAQVIKSRSNLEDGQSVGLSFPYEVIGAEGVGLSNLKMEVVIPKGYQVNAAQVFNNLGIEVKKYVPGEANNTVSVTAEAGGKFKVTFPFDGLREAYPLLKLALNPATKAALKNAKGQTMAPLKLTPIMSGQYTKAAPPPPAPPPGTRTVTKMAPPPPPVPLQISTRSLTAALPTLADSAKDAKIFVGRCAPVSVRRGEEITYTIFVGNLSPIQLGDGTIEMSIPAGCSFVRSTSYAFNGLGPNGAELGLSSSAFAASVAGLKVTWKIGQFFASEGGAVTLTVKVREDFTGTRIDDNSCTFDVVNASGKTPGPIGVVVRAGNAATQSADIVQGAVQGLQVEFHEIARSRLMQSFQFSSGSCTITCGGADMLQLVNGTGVVQMTNGRVLVVGPADQVQASGNRLIKDGMVRVAVGPGDVAGVSLTKLPGYTPATVLSANAILTNLHIPASSIVAGGGGNIVAGGGGNMVAGGGGNLIGQGGSTLIGLDGASLIANDGASFTNIANMVAGGGGNLIGQGGSTMVAGGGGNMVAGGGGNIVAAGGGNLIANDGASLIGQDGAGIVAAGAGNLIGQDGASIVAGGGGNIFSMNTGNLIQANGLVTLPNKF